MMTETFVVTGKRVIPVVLMASTVLVFSFVFGAIFFVRGKNIMEQQLRARLLSRTDQGVVLLASDPRLRQAGLLRPDPAAPSILPRLPKRLLPPARTADVLPAAYLPDPPRLPDLPNEWVQDLLRDDHLRLR